MQHLQKLFPILKKIWLQNRSLRGRFLLYLFSLVSVIISTLLLILGAFGIVHPLDYDFEKYLDYELNVRTNSLSRQMNALGAHGMDLSEQLGYDIEATLNEQGADLNIEKLNNNPQLLYALQAKAYHTLEGKMQNSFCSGALYLVNASVNTGLMEQHLNGLYLKFANVYSENTILNEICMFRGSSDLAREHKINLYSTWQPELSISAYPQAYELLAQAATAPGQVHYLLTDVASLQESWEQARLYLLPIYSSNGQLLGVCGFELSNLLLQLNTRQSSYQDYPLVSAILEKDKHSDDKFTATLSNPSLVQSDSFQVISDGRYDIFISGSNSFVGKLTEFNVGDSKHYLAVMITTSNYNELLRRSHLWLAGILLAVLLISLLSSYFLSKKYVAPILKDLQQLQSNPAQPPPFNLEETKQFYSILQDQAQQHEESLLMLNQQRQLAQKKYAAAAANLARVQQKQASIEQQYQQLSQQLESLLAEKNRAEAEKAQAQQQFSFAKEKLEQIVEQKLSTIDAEGYQLFLDNIATLTKKEREIFDLYTQGLSSKEIIARQQISENTLKYHNKNIYSKLGVKSRKELLQYITLMENSQEKK